MIIVGPGNYGRVTFDRKGGIADSPIVLDADPSGAMTGDAPGPVRIEVDEGLFAIRLTQSPYIIIDGFTLSGATADNGAGIIVRSSSHNTTIRNCEIMGNRDGVRAQDSDDLLVFNNLIVDNTNRGILVGGAGGGSQRARLINNTIVRNGGAGIFIGNNDVASTDAVVRNNILQDNAGRNFDIDDGPQGPASSADGLSADFNLLFASTGDPACSPESQQASCGYGPLAVRGANDVNADAQFDDPGSNNFLLNQRDSPAVDAGDPELESLVGSILEQRTTAPRGTVDEVPFDLGYHNPQPEG
jgi:parallel beta-helix repeat protein